MPAGAFVNTVAAAEAAAAKTQRWHGQQRRHQQAHVQRHASVDMQTAGEAGRVSES